MREQKNLKIKKIKNRERNESPARERDKYEQFLLEIFSTSRLLSMTLQDSNVADF